MRSNKKKGLQRWHSAGFGSIAKSILRNLAGPLKISFITIIRIIVQKDQPSYETHVARTPVFCVDSQHCESTTFNNKPFGINTCRWNSTKVATDNLLVTLQATLERKWGDNCSIPSKTSRGWQQTRARSKIYRHPIASFFLHAFAILK